MWNRGEGGRVEWREEEEDCSLCVCVQYQPQSSNISRPVGTEQQERSRRSAFEDPLPSIRFLPSKRSKSTNIHRHQQQQHRRVSHTLIPSGKACVCVCADIYPDLYSVRAGVDLPSQTSKFLLFFLFAHMLARVRANAKEVCCDDGSGSYYYKNRK